MAKLLQSIAFTAAAASLWGCGQAQEETKNEPKCAVHGNPDGQVVTISDGKYDRCFSLITPSNARAPMPVLFFFHGAGGNAGGCGTAELASIANKGGFAFICGEAVQDVFGHGGQWNIPEIITDTTGTPCNQSDSLDVVYMKSIISHLEASPDKYDTFRLFMSGCSMGSAFSGYISQCLKQDRPEHISAFATHSTGVKVKGDGNHMPPDNYNTKYGWGECPGCQYFPFKPVAYRDSLGLKACIFDNSDDWALKTSQNLATTWKQLGNAVETHWGSGGHCEIHSYTAIVNCLDGSSGRLLPGGLLPDTPSPSPPPGPSPGPGGDPPEKCQQCFKEACPEVEQKGSACTECVHKHQAACGASCVPFPFPRVLNWYCGRSTELVV